MITLDGDVIVLDRTEQAEDILPLLHPAKGKKAGGWYIDLGVEDQDVLYRLIDAEILGEDIAIRYIAADGRSAEASASIEEMISGPEGHLCRLKGRGAAPAAFLGDEPKTV
jgi:hypothetical protein